MSSLLRYLRTRFYHDPNENQISQFAVFDKGSRSGFPSDVVAFDYKDGLVAVATSSGEIIFYGHHGASWTLDLNYRKGYEPKYQVIKLLFITNDTLLVLCRGPTIVPIKLAEGVIVKHEEIHMNLSQPYSWGVSHIQTFAADAGTLLFSINNTVYRVRHDKLKLETLFKPEDVSKWITDGGKIVSITSLPEKPAILLLIDDNGVVGVYNEAQFSMKTELRNFEDEPIQQICWSSKNPQIGYGISCNNKYTKWKFTIDKSDRLTAQEMNVYNKNYFGPYPCHPIRHFSVCTDVRNNDVEFLIYQGGKSSGKYDDRELISFSHEDTTEKFELSSKVVGIAIVDSGYDGDEKNGVVLICTKSEIIGIDLNSPSFEMLRGKQFLSINNSNPTSHTRAIEIDENVWNRLESMSNIFWEITHKSLRDWPLYSQEKAIIDANPHRASYRQVYVTGHSNGNVCIWSTGGISVQLMMIIRTSLEFQSEMESSTNCREDFENPVKKIGMYDPFDDDEDISIKRVHFDPKSGTLIATNRGGFILIYEMCDLAKKSFPWKHVSANSERTSKFSRTTLKPRTCELEYAPGYQLQHKSDESSSPLVFLVNNDWIKNISYFHKYHCLGIGGSSGFSLLDVKYGYIVYNKCFNSDDSQNTTVANSTQLQRFKSLKKSLRKTFRRKKKAAEVITDNLDMINAQERISPMPEEREEAFVEREIGTREDLGAANEFEERSPGEVTCLRTLRFPIEDEKHVNDVLAVGLNDGSVYFYTITEHDVGLRMTFKVQQVKKISMSHVQPIVNVDITNEEGYFSSSTKLIVTTDEQLRIYNCLPLTKRDSYKVTANEGLKIKNGVVARISHRRNHNTFESFAVLLTNDGYLRVHSISKPSIFERFSFINGTDVIALDSNYLSRDGEVAHLIKSSELQRSTINHSSRGWRYL